MHHHHPFQYCPQCGSSELTWNGINRFACPTCDFLFYQNTAAACGAILTIDGRILLLRRGEEPARGLLDFPGGFVDPGESVEVALAREIQEEIGMVAGGLTFLCSFPNTYAYHGVTYNTCDLIFTGTLAHAPTNVAPGEVDGFELLDPTEVHARLPEIAFPSLRKGMERYLSQVLTG